MFVTRLVSGIVLLAVMLLTIIRGGALLCAFLLAISLIGMFELQRAAGKRGGKDALSIASYLCAAVYYVPVFLGEETFLMGGVALTLIVLLVIYVLRYPEYRAEEVMCAFFGFVYVAVCLSYIYQTRMYLTDGAYAVWLIVICSWGCDTLAYCAGRLFGRHRMAPVLSPKKTVEGAVGGVAGAALIGGIYAIFAGSRMEMTGSPVISYAVLCACGALVSMVGDLAASAIKRNHDVKDYGNLIPGHGGILDRYDSVIITAPIIFFLARLFARMAG